MTIRIDHVFIVSIPVKRLQQKFKGMKLFMSKTKCACESNNLDQDNKYTARLVVRGYMLRKSHNGARRRG